LLLSLPETNILGRCLETKPPLSMQWTSAFIRS